ncbi:MAG: 2-oxo acid dehydrogenase subunit E2, partial [Clostridiales bacterium]|nr:2-oxo acid dehydrogenase subunit E2 [Clostridiales bacterium]
NNWGTNSIFVIIGDRFKEPVFDENGFVEMHDMINVSVTLDERIADGYYFSKSLRMFKQFLQNPEILDNPLYKEGDRVE